jgi:archaemetzincin
MRTWFPTLLLLACSAGATPDEAYTDPPTRIAAIGTVPPALAHMLSADGFAPLPRPAVNDWLAEHEESGQTFDEFVAQGHQRPTGSIHLQPLASLEHVDQLAEYATAYFDVPTVALSPATLSSVGATTRVHHGQRQVLTTDVGNWLVNRRGDAWLLVGLTTTDLYPDPDWNFVFGQAWPDHHVGVYSFARYADPDPAVVLRRKLGVLSHEVGHLFGMAHCTHFSCVMNGSNHLAETDANPLHLCPVCLHKLHHAVGFDPDVRYRALLKIYEENGLDAEATWVRGRLATD